MFDANPKSVLLFTTPTHKIYADGSKEKISYKEYLDAKEQQCSMDKFLEELDEGLFNKKVKKSS